MSANKFTYATLADMQSKIDKYTLEWQEKLSTLEMKINQFCSSSSFTGAAASSMKAFYGDYWMKLVKATNEALVDYRECFDEYVRAYEEANMGEGTKIDCAELEEIKKDLNNIEPKLEDCDERGRTARKDVKDLVSLTDPSIDGIKAKRKALAKKIDETAEAIDGIEATFKTKLADVNNRTFNIAGMLGQTKGYVNTLDGEHPYDSDVFWANINGGQMFLLATGFTEIKVADATEEGDGYEAEGTLPEDVVIEETDTGETGYTPAPPSDTTSSGGDHHTTSPSNTPPTSAETEFVATTGATAGTVVAETGETELPTEDPAPDIKKAGSDDKPVDAAETAPAPSDAPTDAVPPAQTTFASEAGSIVTAMGGEEGTLKVSMDTEQQYTADFMWHDSACSVESNGDGVTVTILTGDNAVASSFIDSGLRACGVPDSENQASIILKSLTESETHTGTATFGETTCFCEMSDAGDYSIRITKTTANPVKDEYLTISDATVDAPMK